MRNGELKNIAGHLTAANLFGYQPQERLPEPIAKVLQNDNVVKAIYPAIIDEAFARTMDNYRKYVSDYNSRVKESNLAIDKHNAAVQIYKKNKQLAEYEQQILRNFLIRFANLNAWEYNAEVDNAGETFSKFIEKQRIQPIRYATEQIFQNMLYMYNRQLMTRNSEYMRLGVKHPQPIMEFEINAYHITTIKRNEIISLDICNKTVRNHRARLTEAGIITNYTFCGSKRGVKTHINAEILEVLDLQTNKIARAENQCVTPENEKVLPNTNETTGTFLKEYNKRESATPDSCDKELPTATGSLDYKNVFYRNTGCKLKISHRGAAPETVKVSETLSDKLRELIMHPQDLAEKLTAGHYNNYIPLDLRLLYKEAYGGTLTRSEYRELVIQDFFKSAAKLYRFSTAFAGSWKNAINSYMNYKFLTHNNIEFNKAIVFEDIPQLRWRLEDARKWFAKPNVVVSASYPSVYFDFTRKTKKELGFEYTMKRWERHLKYQDEQPAKKRKLERNAENRKKNINNSKKYEDAVRLFLNGKKDFNWLIEYIQNNLPVEFYNSLQYTLESLQTTIKA